LSKLDSTCEPQATFDPTVLGSKTADCNVNTTKFLENAEIRRILGIIVHSVLDIDTNIIFKIQFPLYRKHKSNYKKRLILFKEMKIISNVLT